MKAIGSETPLRLTTDPAVDTLPRWSPDGRTIAFERALSGGRIAIMLIPPLGGPERRLVDFVSHWYETIPSFPAAPGLCWSPDGKWLAVAGDMGTEGSDRILLVSVETGEARPLSQPPSMELGDYVLDFSPDGSEFLFLRAAKLSPGNMYRLSLGPGFFPRGEPQELPTPGLSPIWAEWAGAGRGIVFTTTGDGGVYRMAATGASAPVRIESLGTGVASLALSRDGRRLAYSVGARNSTIRRLDLAAGDAAAAPERFIASTRRDVFPQYSPDGRRIAFYSNRAGASSEIWVCEADGSKATAITSMKRGTPGSPRWSPDGRTIVFDSSSSGIYQVYTVGTDGGKVRQITSGAPPHFGSNWSRDGRWIYFTTDSPGGAQVWKVPSQGGTSVQVTSNGGIAATESVDGKTLYYVKSAGKGSLWKMPVGGGPEEKIADSIYRVNYALTDKGVYLTRDGSIDFLNFATGESRSLLKAPRPDLGLTISPDGRYLLFAQVDSVGDDLMLVENFPVGFTGFGWLAR